MPEKLAYMVSMFYWAIDVIMTAGTIALMFIASEIIYLLVLIVMAIYWPGRLKREIRDNHQGSFKKYIKFLFSKYKKK